MIEFLYSPREKEILALSIEIPIKQFFGGLNNFVNGEAEFLIENRSRSAGAETIHADNLSLQSGVMFPAEPDSRFHGDAGSYRWRQNAVTIFLGLAIKYFPTGKRDNSYLCAIFRKLAGCGKRNRYLRTCGDQKQFRVWR